MVQKSFSYLSHRASDLPDFNLFHHFHHLFIHQFMKQTGPSALSQLVLRRLSGRRIGPEPLTYA